MPVLWQAGPQVRLPGAQAGQGRGPGGGRVSDTKLGRRSGAGTRFFRFVGAAQPELVGQVGEQKEKLGAAVCGPFRVAAARLGAGGPGEASPAGPEPFRRSCCCRSPGAIPPPDPREAAVRPSGAEGKRRNEGKSRMCWNHSCVYVGAFLSPTSSEHVTTASLFPEQ